MTPPSAHGRTSSGPRRNPQVRRAILDATVEVLEEVGYKKLTIEAVAARAGVGKQTIYRWWSGKADLVMEAYIDVAEVRAPEPDTGNVTGDLHAILDPVFALNARYDHGNARVVKGLMAEAQLDRAFLEKFSTLIRAWHSPLVNVLERGKARGELRADVNSEALVDIMLGASWYRVLLEHAPLDAAFAHTLISTVVNGNRLRNPLDRREGA